MRFTKTLMLAIGLGMTGCAVVYETPVTVVEPERRPYVDAHVYIPDEIVELIADRAGGYRMPSVSRYSYELYPASYRDPGNLPCYIKADFNGDGIVDYAFMFSKDRYTCCDWYLTTRMIVVTSDCCGYRVSLDLILGTVTAPSSSPIEEYWGIRLLRKGTHTIGVIRNGVRREESVTLQNDGIYLASLDPQERSVFYAAGNEIYEITFDMGSIAKSQAGVKPAERGDRVIKHNRAQ